MHQRFTRSRSIRSKNWAARWTYASTSSFVAGGSNPYWLISLLLRIFSIKDDPFQFQCSGCHICMQVLFNAEMALLADAIPEENSPGSMKDRYVCTVYGSAEQTTFTASSASRRLSRAIRSEFHAFSSEGRIVCNFPSAKQSSSEVNPLTAENATIFFKFVVKREIPGRELAKLLGRKDEDMHVISNFL